MNNAEKNLMQQIVLSYPRLQKRVGGNPEKTEKAMLLLKEIAADFSPMSIKPLVKLLDFLKKWLYDDIKIHFEDNYDFSELVKNNAVIVVPNHQSHADYVILNYFIYKLFKIPLYVAGGINLNVFPIGKLFRKSGCFFIRRSFNSDVLYRLVLEAYIYYLLKTKKPVEFFFEGGRSRSGKLLSPKFGLYHLLFEAHSALEEDERPPMKFVPASIVHEYVPEQKTLSKELQGAKKKKESFFQVLKVFNIFSKDLGTIHVRFGKPIDARVVDNAKETTHNIAFDSFRAVGRNMTVTPAALLSMILLDCPDGALKWDSILKRAQIIIDFCKRFDAPLSPSFDEDLNEVLERAMDQMITNKKAKALGRTRFGHVFYFIRPEARLEVLYFKNTIIHHFLSAWMVNLLWINIFNGSITTEEEVSELFKTQRNRLKMEFYLPSYNDLIKKSLEIISYTIGRHVDSLEECLHFEHKDLFNLASGLSVFARGYSYIVESYFVATRAVRALSREGNTSFTFDQFKKEFNAIHSFEMKHGGLIKYKEGATKPLVKSSLKYLEKIELVKNEMGKYSVLDFERVEQLITAYQSDLSTELMFNVRES